MSSQHNSTLPILISGAGPAGLVLAITLLKNNIAVRIIDKSLRFNNTERGALLQPRSLELLNLLGVLQGLQKTGSILPPMRIYEPSGGAEPIKTIRMFPHQDAVPSIPWPNALVHGQQRTEAALRSHLEQYGVHVELGTELLSFEQDSQGITARIVNRTDGRETEEIVRAHWLVGADGARGVVRKHLGLSFMGETRPSTEQFVLADVHLTGLDRNHWHVWGDASTEFLLIRPTEQDDDGCWMMAGGKIDHAKLIANHAEFVDLVRRVTNRGDFEIGEITQIVEYRPNVRMVDTFGDGRVFVVGDAAHVHSVTGGQGLNSSIQDSFNLGWKLALVEKGLSPSSILSTYTSERLPVIAEMLQRTTALLEKAVSGGSDFSTWQRDASLTQLGINYRWSEVVVDERNKGVDGTINAYGALDGGSLRAGDRAPDAPALKDMSGTTDTVTSFFRIFSPAQHTVLLFTNRPDGLGPILDVLDTYPDSVISSVIVLPHGTSYAPGLDRVNMVLQDMEGYAYVGYGVAAAKLTVVIVRPDGVVGALVHGASGVQRYRDLLFYKA